MKRINFTKMVASGNDFVVVDSLFRFSVVSLRRLAQEICDRKFGVGADGLLVLEKSKVADVKMRIFNADGSEAQMCGNGARCIALFKSKVQTPKSKVKIETKAGIIESQVNKDKVRIRLTEPRLMQLGIPIKINNRQLKVNFVNTGVPHSVIFVEGLDKIDVAGLGNQIRHHLRFKPAGTNVDFVEVLNNIAIKVRTYERGVEDETLACGTGAVASALLYAKCFKPGVDQINVHTRGGETLKVYLGKVGDSFKNLWLEGKVKIVYKGVICIQKNLGGKLCLGVQL